MTLPVALTVAGSDSGGGAGIQADLKTFEARGVFGTSAVTALTSQSTRGVHDVRTLDPPFVRSQIQAVVDDLRPAAVKTGMLANAGIVEAVADALDEVDAPLVVDPVMVSENGDRLLDELGAEGVRRHLLPQATLVTPNLPEAEQLLGTHLEGVEGMRKAAPALAELGPDAVLLTGGHLEGPEVVDLLWHEGEVTELRRPRIATSSTHGTGCTLSAAIAAGLARGASLQDAVGEATALVDRGLRYGHDLGGGAGPVHHLAELRNAASRWEALEAADRALHRLERADVHELVPEVGLNVAVATPYATGPRDVAAGRGRIVRVREPAPSGSGDRERTVLARRAGGTGLGASEHVGRFLLALREHDVSVGAVANARYGEDVAHALDELGWDRATVPWDEEPERVREDEGASMPWEAQVVMEDRDRAPVAVVDPGRFGKEPMTKLVAGDGDELVARALALRDALQAQG